MPSATRSHGAMPAGAWLTAFNGTTVSPSPRVPATATRTPYAPGAMIQSSAAWRPATPPTGEATSGGGSISGATPAGAASSRTCFTPSPSTTVTLTSARPGRASGGRITTRTA